MEALIIYISFVSLLFLGRWLFEKVPLEFEEMADYLKKFRSYSNEFRLIHIGGIRISEIRFWSILDTLHAKIRKEAGDDPNRIWSVLFTTEDEYIRRYPWALEYYYENYPHKRRYQILWKQLKDYVI